MITRPLNADRRMGEARPAGPRRLNDADARWAGPEPAAMTPEGADSGGELQARG
jgi:hypothetical protein